MRDTNPLRADFGSERFVLLGGLDRLTYDKLAEGRAHVASSIVCCYVRSVFRVNPAHPRRRGLDLFEVLAFADMLVTMCLGNN